jgi:hypothetical protein
MICPLPRARELSASVAGRYPWESRRTFGVSRVRVGAGDAGPGSHDAGVERRDPLVPGGGDSRRGCPDDAPVAAIVRAPGLSRAVRSPAAEVERVLRLYRERYRGFNVRHFYEIAQREHQVRLSYSWVKDALQLAGLVPPHLRRPRGHGTPPSRRPPLHLARPSAAGSL